MVVYKARAVLGDGNSTCKGPGEGIFVSWRKDEMAQVVESERDQWGSSECTFSLLPPAPWLPSLLSLFSDCHG